MSRTKRDRAVRTGPVPGPQHDTGSRAIPAHAIEPYDGGGYVSPVPFGGTYQDEEWLCLRPTPRNDREEGYYRAVTPVRAVLRFLLWLTYRPERLVVLFVVIAMLAAVVKWG